MKMYCVVIDWVMIIILIRLNNKVYCSKKFNLNNFLKMLVIKWFDFDIVLVFSCLIFVKKNDFVNIFKYFIE